MGAVLQIREFGPSPLVAVGRQPITIGGILGVKVASAAKGTQFSDGHLIPRAGVIDSAYARKGNLRQYGDFLVRYGADAFAGKLLLGETPNEEGWVFIQKGPCSAHRVFLKTIMRRSQGLNPSTC